MNYNNELIKLHNQQQKLIQEAQQNGYIYDSKNNTFNKQDELIYIIHISINTLGSGESLGKFEIYDKVFQVDERLANIASKINNLEDFMEDVLFYKDWDNDFLKCSILDEVHLSDRFYHDTNRSCYKDYENIITFSFSYIDSTMGNVTIMKCKPEILNTHKSIYHYTKNYVIE